MRILFLSHYFPPEGNAPASRVHAMTRRWVEAGHEVTVITCAPNVPDGKVYDGYRNRLCQREVIDGVEVIRVWTYLAANKGTARRIANFVSYMVTATLRGAFERRPDVLIATSPQFFCGWAGVLLGRLKAVPFVLEVRDLWPESIEAVGAMSNRKALALLERMEDWLYRAAKHIVTVGPGYRQRLLEKGVPDAKLSVIPNGVETRAYQPRPKDAALEAEFGLGGRFVCAYIGTIGMAHGLEVVLAAAEQLRQRGRTGVRFLIVGDGAARADLQAEADRRGLTGLVTFTGRRPKEQMPAFLATADACLVHLKRTPLFTTVLPSKIFEALAMKRPIILGVEGHVTSLLVESGGGLAIEPENGTQLADAVERLADNPTAAHQFGSEGHDYVLREYDLDKLAARYLDVLRRVSRV